MSATRRLMMMMLACHGLGCDTVLLWFVYYEISDARWQIAK